MWVIFNFFPSVFCHYAFLILEISSFKILNLVSCLIPRLKIYIPRFLTRPIKSYLSLLYISVTITCITAIKETIDRQKSVEHPSNVKHRKVRCTDNYQLKGWDPKIYLLNYRRTSSLFGVFLYHFYLLAVPIIIGSGVRALPLAAGINEGGQ